MSKVKFQTTFEIDTLRKLKIWAIDANTDVNILLEALVNNVKNYEEMYSILKKFKK